MINKEKKYNLNLDSLVPFFLISNEEIKKRAWFKAKKEEYEEVVKECYGSISTILEDNEKIIRWKNESWKCKLFDKEVTFILEKKENSNWKEVKFVEKIFFSNWNIEKNSFELQIKETLGACLEKEIVSFSEPYIRFKLRFHGQNERNKPDILISLIGKNNEVKKENKIALEITQADTSPPNNKKGSLHEILDQKLGKEDFKGAKKIKKILDKIPIASYLPNLFKNTKKSLVKKNNKNYDCGKTIIWIILLAYCHVDIKDSAIGKEFCLAQENREVDEKFFSRFLLEEIKKISKEFKIEKKKITFNHLIVKFAVTKQKMISEGKWYKFITLVKEILHIPVIDSEIRVKEEMKKINDKYKDKLDNLEISLYGNVPNWETTKLLMDDNEKKYYEVREKKNRNIFISIFNKKSKNEI